MIRQLLVVIAGDAVSRDLSHVCGVAGPVRIRQLQLWQLKSIWS
jgi:hypothetical protein